MESPGTPVIPRLLFAGSTSDARAALIERIAGWECVTAEPETVRAIVTGAFTIDAIVLLIDADADLESQSAPARLLPFFGISRVLAVVAGANPGHAIFESVQKEWTEFLADLDIAPRHFIAADDSPSLAAALAEFRIPADKPLRLVLQDTFRIDNRRVLAGRIVSGRLAVGDELVFRPDRKRGRLKSIEAWDANEAPRSAATGQVVGITLEEPLSVERGHIASHPGTGPAEGTEIRASLFWTSDAPLLPNGPFVLQLGTQEVEAQLVEILSALDSATLEIFADPPASVYRNQIADVRIRCRKPIVYDRCDFIAETSRFTMLFGGIVIGGGIVREADYDKSEAAVASDNITWTMSPVTREARAGFRGHRGVVVWLTGLSASGKSTLAVGLEWKLHMLGLAVFILDGDNLRHGLCSNLKFSPEDRSENIRRAGETAKLMADAGVIVICSLISPYAADRARVREICHRDGIPFTEVFVNTPIEVCEARDPRGLYKKARAGEIRDFTGIGSAYEAPKEPDLEVRTAENSLSRCLEILQDHVLDLGRPLQAGFAHEFESGSGI